MNQTRPLAGTAFCLCLQPRGSGPHPKPRAARTVALASSTKPMQTPSSRSPASHPQLILLYPLSASLILPPIIGSEPLRTRPAPKGRRGREKQVSFFHKMWVFYLMSLPLNLGMAIVTLRYFAGPHVPTYVLFTVGSLGSAPSPPSSSSRYMASGAPARS